MKIFIASHKDYDFPTSEIYIPIQVGSSINNKIIGVSHDDVGDNISGKNPYFCELTALYWMWKNCNENIIGLVHYRRYFSSKNKQLSIAGHNIISHDELLELMNDTDIILPTKKEFQLEYKNVFYQYKAGHYIKDLLSVRDIIEKRHKDYLESFDKIMSQNSLYICNMFIARKHYIDSYCEWLFDILFSLEKTISLNGYSQHQKRVFGFLSERLFNVWLEKNKTEIRYKNMEVINIEDLSRGRENSISKKHSPLVILKKIKLKISYHFENNLRRLKNRIYLFNNKRSI
ncbi:DUF4422 domain-containing protein [Xenorhabdus khoisanae]|uniref:DUF4422 domain-containing protein n=1 Tax=Xenorhabdus khoisanae TaxID=880157 RepID=UPI0032B779C8